MSTREIEEFIVPWVRESAPYSDKHMDFAWQHPDVGRMMSNENPLPPPESVVEAVLEVIRKGNLYPGSGEELRRKLAEPFGLGPDNVVLGNGSTDVINFIIHALVAPGEEVVIPVPTFAMYETRTLIHGGKPVLIPTTSDFYWDVAGMIKAATPKTKLIFVCTPNNPTGNQIRETDLRLILKEGIPTVIDEAYFELEERPRSLAFLIREYPNAIINRTMSKAFGLAGLRVGYCFANEKLISYFNRTKFPWNVSLLALAAALAALDDKEDQKRKYDNNYLGRVYLQDAIDEIPGLKSFESDGNFVLFDASVVGKDSNDMRDDLIARGVFIRPMSPHHMKPGFMRVTIGTPEQNKKFIEILRAYVAEQKNTVSTH